MPSAEYPPPTARHLAKGVKPRKNKNYRPRDEQVRLTEARAGAMELRRQGLTYRQIAAKMNIGVKTAYDYVQAELLWLREHTAEDTYAVRDIELDRCEAMINSLWKRIKDGDAAAVAVAVRVMERKARLLGLDAPVRSESMTASMAFTPEEAAKMSNDALFDYIKNIMEQAAVAKIGGKNPMKVIQGKVE